MQLEFVGIYFKSNYQTELYLDLELTSWKPPGTLARAPGGPLEGNEQRVKFPRGVFWKRAGANHTPRELAHPLFSATFKLTQWGAKRTSSHSSALVIHTMMRILIVMMLNRSDNDSLRWVEDNFDNFTCFWLAIWHICLSQASPNNNNKKKHHYHLLQYNTNAFDRLPVVSIEPNSLLIAAAAEY